MTRLERFLEFITQLSLGLVFVLALLLAMGMKQEQLLTLFTTGQFQPLTAEQKLAGQEDEVKSNQKDVLLEAGLKAASSKSSSVTDNGSEPSATSNTPNQANQTDEEKGDFSDLFD